MPRKRQPHERRDGTVPGIIAEGEGEPSARILGTAIEVWEVISVYKSVEHEWERLKEAMHWLTEDQLHAALTYAETYPDYVHACRAQEAMWTPEQVWRKYPFTKPEWR